MNTSTHVEEIVLIAAVLLSACSKSQADNRGAEVEASAWLDASGRPPAADSFQIVGPIDVCSLCNGKKEGDECVLVKLGDRENKGQCVDWPNGANDKPRLCCAPKQPAR